MADWQKLHAALTDAHHFFHQKNIFKLPFRKVFLSRLQRRTTAFVVRSAQWTESENEMRFLPSLPVFLFFFSSRFKLFLHNKTIMESFLTVLTFDTARRCCYDKSITPKPTVQIRFLSNLRGPSCANWPCRVRSKSIHPDSFKHYRTDTVLF